MATIDLDLLPVFVALASSATFSAAAARLQVPKSSVSRRLAALERRLGVQLFHRTTRKIAITTAGTALLDQIGAPLAALQSSLLGMPDAQQEPAGRLRITAPIDFGTDVLAEITARFAARYPHVELDIRLTNAEVDLVGEGFDVGLRITRERLKDSALVARLLSPVPAGLFASPGYLARRGIPRLPADLHEHAWVLFARPQKKLWLSDGRRRATTTPGKAIECDDVYFARELLRQGAGVGILPTFTAGRDVVEGTLVPVLPGWTHAPASLWLLRPSGARAPRKVAAFESFVRASLRARPMALLEH